MIDSNSVYDFMNNNAMITNNKIYESDSLNFIYFYNEDKPASKFMKVLIYFEIVHDVMCVSQSTVIWKNDYVTYKSPDDTPEEFYFYNYPSKKDLTIYSPYSKDEFFNISVLYGIAESDLDLIRKWHSDYTNLFNSTLYNFVKA